jgi:hypothetical protein
MAGLFSGLGGLFGGGGMYGRGGGPTTRAMVPVGSGDEAVIQR